MNCERQITRQLSRVVNEQERTIRHKNTRIQQNGSYVYLMDAFSASTLIDAQSFSSSLSRSYALAGTF
jgi:hypothetical protein